MRRATVAALGRLPSDEARARVLGWAAGAYSARFPTGPVPGTQRPRDAKGGEALSELLDRAGPTNRQERLLTVAYWLQMEQGQAEWTAQAVNDRLKDLGEGIPNITDALATLAQRRPGLVRQLRKTGRTRQARKRYSLTEAGRQAVRGLIEGQGG